MARAGRTSRRITWMRKTRSARTRSSAARSRDCFSFLLFFRLRSRAASDWALRQTKFIALTNRQRSHLDRSASVAHAAEAVLRHHRSRGAFRYLSQASRRRSILCARLPGLFKKASSIANSAPSPSLP